MAKKEKIDALVPVEEQPYPVPENWRWVRLGGITQVVGGGTPSSGNKEYYENGDIPWISPADLSNYNDMYISQGAKSITPLGLQNSSARLMPKNTVCLSTRAPIGYVAIARNELSTNQGFKSFLPSSCYIPQFLYWYLKGNKDMLEAMASGTTFLELSGSKAAMIMFPLAPLSEQQRIIDRIESLFAKLDEAKEKAQAVVDGFEDRKAAILHKAFTGELTRNWRNSNLSYANNWKMMIIGDVGEVITGSTPSTKNKEFFDGKVPFVKPSDLNQGRHVMYSSDTLSEKGKDVSRPVRAGTTCVCCIGTIGKCGYLEVDGVTNQQINSIIPNSFMNDIYVYYYCCSKAFQDKLWENSSSTTISIVNKSKMSALSIPVPEKEEQDVIALTLDRLFENEAKALLMAETVLSQIDTMKKAILARAFRGELGTNDPTEPPIVVGG